MRDLAVSQTRSYNDNVFLDHSIAADRDPCGVLVLSCAEHYHLEANARASLPKYRSPKPAKHAITGLSPRLLDSTGGVHDVSVLAQRGEDVRQQLVGITCNALQIMARRVL